MVIVCILDLSRNLGLYVKSFTNSSNIFNFAYFPLRKESAYFDASFPNPPKAAVIRPLLTVSKQTSSSDSSEMSPSIHFPITPPQNVATGFVRTAGRPARVIIVAIPPEMAAPIASPTVKSSPLIAADTAELTTDAIAPMPIVIRVPQKYPLASIRDIGLLPQ